MRGGTESYNQVSLSRREGEKREEKRSSDGRTLSADDVRLNGAPDSGPTCSATGE